MTEQLTAMASDFDGTLYFMQNADKYRPGDLEAIYHFQNRGGLFGLCTGRSLRGILDTEGGRAVDWDFYLLASGALILDRDRHVLHRECISRRLMKEIHRRYEERVEIVVQANDTVYNLRDTYTLQQTVASLDDIEGDHIYGLSFGAASREEAAQIAAEINRDHAGEVTARVNVTHVDISPAGCSKGSALRFIRRRLGITCCGGIGDSFNDLPMLQAADRSFTFPAAPEAVRRAVDDIVESVAEALAILQRPAAR
ncbi:MAG: HAD-IIB family hydrolase [Anaerovoracaceae bacterium]